MIMHTPMINIYAMQVNGVEEMEIRHTIYSGSIQPIYIHYLTSPVRIFKPHLYYQ
ncbi:hypothetical protein Sjap_001998 [Stephania japonica]|uniref:Uncharacterized protein n=1 Tax=Stephania japonica TaxID=461633 RepID=A0AAP0KML6_9MAGN